MEIIPYCGEHDAEIRALILGIQNGEAGIGLTLGEQPDLLDIRRAYQEPGGGFWLASDGGKIVGTIGLMPLSGGCAALKKFFVAAPYRSMGFGLALYRRLLSFARETSVKQLVLDTPAVAAASHRFYERAGFRRITPEALPVRYDYPDRNSRLYLLNLEDTP